MGVEEEYLTRFETWKSKFNGSIPNEPLEVLWGEATLIIIHGREILRSAAGKPYQIKRALSAAEDFLSRENILPSRSLYAPDFNYFPDHPPC